MSPIEQHRTWRFLLRALVAEHAELRAASTAELQFGLAAPVALAWWVTQFSPALKEAPSAHVVLSAHSPLEVVDSGRWFQLLPWLLGCPSLDLHVSVQIRNLAEVSRPGPGNSPTLLSTFARDSRGPLASFAQRFRPADVRVGKLSEGLGQSPSLIALMHPGFADDVDYWFDGGELEATLRVDRPVAVFSYTEIEYLYDRATAAACGYEACADGRRSPWGEGPAQGQYGGWGWDLSHATQAGLVDDDTLAGLELVKESMSREDPESYDAILASLGSSVAARHGKEASEIVLLPDGYGVERGKGLVLQMSERGGSVVEPEIRVPPEAFDTYEAVRNDPVRRAIWAARVSEEHLEQTRLLFPPDLDLKPALHEMGAAMGLGAEQLEALHAAFGEVQEVEISETAARAFELLESEHTHDLIELLGEHPELADARNAKQEPLLLRATLQDELEVVAKCISVGAKVDACAPDGWAPINAAARLQRIDILRLLLEAGADANHMTGLRWTPLMIAVQHVNQAGTTLLLQHNANPLETMVTGETVVQYARKVGVNLGIAPT